MKYLALLVGLFIGCGELADEDVIETQSAVHLAGGTYGSVGFATWTGNGQPTTQQSSDASAVLSFNAITQKYTFTRTDKTQGRFLSCTVTMVKKTGTVSCFGAPARMVCGSNQQWYEQVGDAPCTWGSSSFTVKAATGGPYRLYDTNPYAMPGENMAGLERLSVPCCGPNGNDTSSGPYTLSIVSYLDPGVTIHDYNHALWPPCSTCSVDLNRTVVGEQVVWRQYFGMTARMPEVEWMPHVCGVQSPPVGGFLSSGGVCVKGEMMGTYFDMKIRLDHDMSDSRGMNEPIDSFNVDFPYEQPLTALWMSSWTHELCHARRQVLTGDGDAGHMSDCFCNAGETGPCTGGPNMHRMHEHGLVGQVNDVLKANGI